MQTSPYRRLSAVFVVLVALSVMAWFIVNSDAYTRWRYVGSALLIVGLFKAWLVGYEFMEIRHSPIPLRIVFWSWLIVTGTAILTISLV